MAQCRFLQCAMSKLANNFILRPQQNRLLMSSGWQHYFDCPLDIFSSINESNGDNSDLTMYEWREMRVPGMKFDCPVSFKQNLFAFMILHKAYGCPCKVYCYTPLRRRWVHVGDVPTYHLLFGSVAIAPGRCVVITG